MPLVGFHCIEFEKGPITFTEKELRLLSSQNHQRRVADFFADSPYRFNLFFRNHKWKGREDYLLHGKVFRWNNDEEDYRIRMQHFLDGRKTDHDAINVLYTSARTGQAFPIPMTPWILAHRMGHAQMISRIIKPTLNGTFVHLQDVYGYRISTKGVPTDMDWNEHLRPYMALRIMSENGSHL